MKGRFLIRAAGGREYTLGTLDSFVRRVHNGDIAPEDLVFDSLTGEWAPARSHPAYDLSVDPLVTGTGAGQKATPAGDVPSGDADTPIDLVDVDAPSPEAEKRAFIEQMEQERRSDPDRSPLQGEVALVDTRAKMVSELVPERGSGVFPASEREVEGSFSRRRRPVRRVAEHASRHRWSSWAGFSALLCVGLAGTATVAWSALRSNEPFSRTAASLIGGFRAPRTVMPVESALRAGAYQGFLRDVDSLRTALRLYAVPDMWLEGKYLADPSAYPTVRDYWERMATFVETVRDREARLYRNAYLTAAERAGMSGPMLSLHIAGAAGDFAVTEPARDSLYAQVWELASASLALDRAVTALQGRVAYEPLRGPRVSADPVIEAVGVDPDAQAQLESGLDRVLAAMKPLQTGEVTREGAKTRVTDWLENGLRTLGPE